MVRWSWIVFWVAWTGTGIGGYVSGLLQPDVATICVFVGYMGISGEHDHPAVGCAWQAGAEKAKGDYIHLGNDDCEPHPGWWQPAVEACQQGFVPSPMVFTPDGYP